MLSFWLNSIFIGEDLPGVNPDLIFLEKGTPQYLQVFPPTLYSIPSTFVLSLYHFSFYNFVYYFIYEPTFSFITHFLCWLCLLVSSGIFIHSCSEDVLNLVCLLNKVQRRSDNWSLLIFLQVKEDWWHATDTCTLIHKSVFVSKLQQGGFIITAVIFMWHSHMWALRNQ